MRYPDGETIALGDIVDLTLYDGNHAAKVIMIGETGTFISLDERTAKWALESGHIDKDSIMVELLERSPLQHEDPRFAPVSNTLTLTTEGVILRHRA